VNVESGETERR